VLPLYNAIEAVEHAEHLAFDAALIRQRPEGSFMFLGNYLQKLMPQCKLIFVLGLAVIWLAQGLVKDFDYLPERMVCLPLGHW
jgi:hypothetical protein